MGSKRFSPQAVGLAPELYAAALRYLFDRPMPEPGVEEWYWNNDEPEFNATALEWARIETVLFAQAGTDLATYSDVQVGMGLDYITSGAVSDVPHLFVRAPLDEILRTMQAMPAFWRDCIGPRLASPRASTESSTKMLAAICDLWFEHWPATNRDLCRDPLCRDALWQVFSQMLDVPCRAVQMAALYGIALWRRNLGHRGTINRRLEEFIAPTASDDQKLRSCADMARRGRLV